MSLLLEALKKAEKAKEEATRRSGPASTDGLQLEDDGRPLIMPDDKPVMTRNELPDISNPLEIHSEDIAGHRSDMPEETTPEPKRAAPATAPPPAQRASVPTRPASQKAASVQQESGAEQRAAAKNMFEAKFKEPNPKLPFFIAMSVLGACAFGTVVYFWYQLRPPPPLVNPNPPKSASEPNISAPTPAAASSPSKPAASEPSAAPLVPGLASTPPAPPPTESSGSGQPRASATPQVSDQPATKPNAGLAADAGAGRKQAVPTAAPTGSRRPASAASGRDSSSVSVSKQPLQVNPNLEAGWKAYNEGNLTVARAAYEQALREEPASRDALLGMAAVEMRSRRFEVAEALYRRLLDADPRDAHAQAGLLGLRGQLVEPVQVESSVKSLLANDPESQVLNFTLGNQYSLQGRWAEAQQAYFRAHTADPENPDIAYNLAVSLDQLRQSKLALEYYRRALSLAQQRASSFDQGLARNRIQRLSR
jgi:tetratricopeptide (TPR) repeat protein